MPKNPLDVQIYQLDETNTVAVKKNIYQLNHFGQDGSFHFNYIFSSSKSLSELDSIENIAKKLNINYEPENFEELNIEKVEVIDLDSI